MGQLGQPHENFGTRPVAKPYNFMHVYWSCPTEGGMAPPSPYNVKSCNCVSWPIDGGMAPCNDKDTRFVSWPIEYGIVPLLSLKFTVRPVRLVNCPIEKGIVPTTPYNVKVFSPVDFSCSIAGGMGPVTDKL